MLTFVEGSVSASLYLAPAAGPDTYRAPDQGGYQGSYLAHTHTRKERETDMHGQQDTLSHK